MKNTEYSREHLLYLRAKKRAKGVTLAFQLGILFLFLGVWELLAYFELVNPFITSSPSRVWAMLVSLYRDGTLFYHVGVTLSETLVGFAIAVALGTAIALALWLCDGLKRVLEPYLVVLNALPKIALGPLIIIWFGTGSESIIFMTVIIGLIVAVMNMLTAFLSTDKNKILLLRALGASKLQILTKLVLPSSLPAFISMLKINVGMAWIGSVMGEYIVSKAGLGYLIVYGGQVFKLDLVMASTLILCVLAGLMYFAVALVEKLTVRHPS